MTRDDRRFGELRRVFGPAMGIAVCVGSAVGAGILRTPGEVAAALPSGAWILGVWCLGALVASLDTWILAEMASSFPRVGGLVAYVHLSFGRGAAFLAGWSILLITWPGSIASVSLAVGELLTQGAAAAGAGAPPTVAARLTAAALIATLTLVNLTGLRSGSRFEIAITAVKFVLLSGLFAAAALLSSPAAGRTVETARPLPAAGWPLLGAVAVSMVRVLFTYDGYADAVYLAGETRDPTRALPRALALALGLVAGLYLLANVAFLTTLGVTGMADSKFVGLDMTRAALGGTGARLFTATAFVVMAGAVNSYLLTGPRIARLLAEEQLAAPAFGRLSSSGVPAFATLWLGAVAVALVFTNTFGELLDLTIPIIWATNLAVAAGLLVQRRRAPERPRPFRVRGATWVVGTQFLVGLTCLGSFVVSLVDEGRTRILWIDAAGLASGWALFRWLESRRGRGSRSS